MGRVAHKTTSSRRLVTVGELATYFGVHRHTMRSWITAYSKLDMHDIYSIMDFTLWVEQNKL